MSDRHRARSLARGHSSPRFWAEAVRRQLQRVDADRQAIHQGAMTRDGYDALGIDVHFMLIAVHHVLRYQVRYLELTGDERVREGLEEFEATAVDSTYLRNMLEHLDEYVIGEGKHQDEVTAPPRALQPYFVEAGPCTEGDFSFALGQYSVPVRATAEAAIRLAALLGEVWEQHFGELKPRRSG